MDAISSVETRQGLKARSRHRGRYVKADRSACQRIAGRLSRGQPRASDTWFSKGFHRAERDDIRSQLEAWRTHIPYVPQGKSIRPSRANTLETGEANSADHRGDFGHHC